MIRSYQILFLLFAIIDLSENELDMLDILFIAIVMSLELIILILVKKQKLPDSNSIIPSSSSFQNNDVF